MKKISVLLVLLLFPAMFAQAQSPVPAFISDSLETYIQRGMQDWEIPGMSLAIVKDGQIVHSKGYGVRDLLTQKPVDDKTLFYIASNTKLFTGTAIAKLYYEGSLKMDEKVSTYLPWFSLYDKNSSELVSVRDILSHRLGTQTFQGDFTFWGTTLTREQVVRKMALLKPSAPFRQNFGYCNAGYAAAGLVVEQVSGKKWEAYVRDNFLTPLAMYDTYLTSSDAISRPNIATPYSTSFTPLQAIPYDEVDAIGPAGNMLSCAQDMAKWLQLQLDSGRYNGKRILEWGAVYETRKGNTVVNTRKSSYAPQHFSMYGLGLFSGDYNGRQIYWHTGGAFGFVSVTCFVPEENLGLVILTNQDNQSFFEALRYQILDAYLGMPYIDRSAFFLNFHRKSQLETAKTQAAYRSKVNAKPALPVPVKGITGTYKNFLYDFIEIKEENQELQVHFGLHKTLKAKLEYMGQNEFLLSYNNPGYGMHPVKAVFKGKKMVSVEIKAPDFLEYDPYTFSR